MKQDIYSEHNSLASLEHIIKKYAPQKILLITGKKSFISSGCKDLIEKYTALFSIRRWCDFDTNPQFDDMKHAVAYCREYNPDLIISIGGGSVIDTAKTVSLFGRTGVLRVECITQNITDNVLKIPHIAIPTTAGTGSESTSFSVIYVQKTKYSLSHDLLLPDQVILDDRVLNNIPHYVAACAALDALCQGIESFWSVRSTEHSRNLSKRSISMVINNIIDFLYTPTSINRKNMLVASNLAGQAINITKTTAAHSVSYPITSFFNIPHGHAVALTIAEFVKFNSCIDKQSCQDIRGVTFVQNILKELCDIFQVKDTDQLYLYLLQLMKNIEINYSLTSLGIQRTDIDIILKNGFNPQRVENNPRKLLKEDLRKILEHIL